jgi:hypothetical protein
MPVKIFKTPIILFLSLIFLLNADPRFEQFLNYNPQDRLNK